MGSRVWRRASTVLAAAVVGAALLSGSDQPVTAHPFPRWQQVAAPPLVWRTHALGARVGHRVLVLGGVGRSGVALRDGAAYDLRSGRWRHLRTPVALSDADHTASASGSLYVVHARTWWRYEPRADRWSRVVGLPARLSAPTAFHSELYAVSGRRVVVYSTQLGRCSRLPSDPYRPALVGSTVTASRQGTVVTGYAGGRSVADRWDGLRWTRTGAVPPTVGARRSATPHSLRVDVGGRLFVVRRDRAWIYTP